MVSNLLALGMGGPVGRLVNWGNGADVNFLLNKICATQAGGRLRQDICIFGEQF